MRKKILCGVLCFFFAFGNCFCEEVENLSESQEISTADNFSSLTAKNTENSKEKYLIVAFSIGVLVLALAAKKK